VEVTVVIPTFNRYERIQETLSALKNQEYKDFSAIVINDGSSDQRYAQLQSWCDQLPYRCHVISQSNSGASAATNHGVGNAPDGLIILFDDDILPSPSCIRQHVEFHNKHQDCIISGSADTDPERTVTDVQRYKIYMEEQWRKSRPDTERCVAVGFDNFIITTANMSLSRSLFQKLQGFNVSLRDGYDVDFGFRALLNGVQLFFDRNIRSVHNDLISLRYYAGRQRAYTVSKQKIAADHPELRPRLRDIEVAPVSGMKKMVYALLRNNVVVNFMESGSFAWLVPKTIRYRVYGAAIASLSRTA
jgi:glycosyltransferase involved in cell wall biosynthesis